jgi:hypothetical protein
MLKRGHHTGDATAGILVAADAIGCHEERLQAQPCLWHRIDAGMGEQRVQLEDPVALLLFSERTWLSLALRPVTRRRRSSRSDAQSGETPPAIVIEQRHL